MECTNMDCMRAADVGRLAVWWPPTAKEGRGGRRQQQQQPTESRGSCCLSKPYIASELVFFVMFFALHLGIHSLSLARYVQASGTPRRCGSSSSCSRSSSQPGEQERKLASPGRTSNCRFLDHACSSDSTWFVWHGSHASHIVLIRVSMLACFVPGASAATGGQALVAANSGAGGGGHLRFHFSPPQPI